MIQNPVDAVEFTGFPPPKFPIKPEFWTQLDADSVRNGLLGRDDSGICHFSDYRVWTFNQMELRQVGL